MCDKNAQESRVKTNNNNNLNDKSILNLENVECGVDLNQINNIIKSTQQKKWVRCELCNVPLSSNNSVQRHVTGKRHLANIKRLTKKDVEDNKKMFCDVCKVKTNSMKQLEDHLKSNKHKGKMELIERREQLKSNCLIGILIASFIFAIVINIFYALFMYVQPL